MPILLGSGCSVITAMPPLGYMARAHIKQRNWTRRNWLGFSPTAGRAQEAAPLKRWRSVTLLKSNFNTFEGETSIVPLALKPLLGKESGKYYAMNMCYTIRVTSDVVVSCMWENVSTDSNWFVDVDVGASNFETLCRWLAVSNDKR